MNREEIFTIIGLILFCVAIGLSEKTLLGSIQSACILGVWYFALNSQTKPKMEKAWKEKKK